MAIGIPTISVVIPTYNRQGSILNCIRSVQEQSVAVTEIIVVDDCSDDGTISVVRTVDDPRIRLVCLTHRSGAQSARNAGIREARGKWIAFLDSDDEWLPTKIERQLEVVNRVGNNPFVVVHTDCWISHRAGQECTLWNIPAVEGDEAYQRLLAVGGPLFQAMLTSRIALEEIGLLDEAVPSFQEWDTAIRLAKICRFYHVKEPLFIYHRYGNDTISGNPMRAVVGYKYIIEKFRDEIRLNCGENAVDAHLRYCALRALQIRAFSEAREILETTSRSSLKTLFLIGMSDLGKAGGQYLAKSVALLADYMIRAFGAFNREER